MEYKLANGGMTKPSSFMISQYNHQETVIAELRAEVERLKDGIKRCQITMIVDGGDMAYWGWATILKRNRKMKASLVRVDG